MNVEKIKVFKHNDSVKICKLNTNIYDRYKK